MIDPTPTPPPEDAASQAEQQLHALLNTAERFANIRATMAGMVQGMLAEGWTDEQARNVVAIFVMASLQNGVGAASKAVE
jgi:hypothetical protein